MVTTCAFPVAPVGELLHSSSAWCNDLRSLPTMTATTFSDQLSPASAPPPPSRRSTPKVLGTGVEPSFGAFLAHFAFPAPVQTSGDVTPPRNTHVTSPPVPDAEHREAKVPARPANFVPPFLTAELHPLCRPRRSIDLTGPHPLAPPPSALIAASYSTRRKRRYASGKLLVLCQS